MAQAKTTSDVPELLQRGLEIYKALKNHMHGLLRLKENTENLTKLTQNLRAVHKYLNEEERAIEETLQKAHRLSREGLRGAVMVVSIIKEQCKTLALVLSDSVPGKKHEKLADVCLYFSEFAKDTAANVKEALDSLQKASNELEDAQGKLTVIVKAMQRVHTELLSEQKASEARVRVVTYAAEAAFGPVDLLITWSNGVAAGITEGYTIKKLNKEFSDRQQTNVEEYIVGFKKIHEETREIADKIKTKCDNLLKIHTKLATTKELTDVSEPHFANVCKHVNDLCKVHDEFKGANGANEVPACAPGM